MRRKKEKKKSEERRKMKQQEDPTLTYVHKHTSWMSKRVHYLFQIIFQRILEIFKKSTVRRRYKLLVMVPVRDKDEEFYSKS